MREDKKPKNRLPFLSRDPPPAEPPEPQKRERSFAFNIFGKSKDPEEKETEDDPKKRRKELLASRKRQQDEKKKVIEERKNKEREARRKEKEESKKMDKQKRQEAEVVSNTSNSTNPFTFAQKFVSGIFNGRGGEEWVPIVPKTRLDPGEIVPVTVNGIDLLVIASKDGRKLYSIANSCPHLGTPLETGKLVRLPIENSPTPSESLPLRKSFTEQDVATLLAQDGCEDCIVCPLHRTAFALKSGDVRGEWCPYPPVVGKLVGTIKSQTSVAVFDVRTRGKQVEVRINTPIDLRNTVET